MIAETTAIIGREFGLYDADIESLKGEIEKKIAKSSFLVIGGAGTIGKSAVKEIFVRNPKRLHVIDVSENNLVELVRDLRSTFGYIDGDFRTFAIDCGSAEFDALLNVHCDYDYVLNLSALKHVRSEKDQFTLMRMIQTNIFNTVKIITHPKLVSAKHFCVSTDKAANPANMMGASKSIMEKFVFASSQNVSLARFANVAFSDGSLLDGFEKRMSKQQPITAPVDIKRYFITQKEAGQLCVLSVLFGNAREIFVPKQNDSLRLISFADVARNYLLSKQLTPEVCSTEEQARQKSSNIDGKTWPCYFFASDTTGEKPFEEFYTDAEKVNNSRFLTIDVVLNEQYKEIDKLQIFQKNVLQMLEERSWTKADLLNEFLQILPDFNHVELHKNLDERM